MTNIQIYSLALCLVMALFFLKTKSQYKYQYIYFVVHFYIFYGVLWVTHLFALHPRLLTPPLEGFNFMNTVIPLTNLILLVLAIVGLILFFAAFYNYNSRRASYFFKIGMFWVNFCFVTWIINFVVVMYYSNIPRFSNTAFTNYLLFALQLSIIASAGAAFKRFRESISRERVPTNFSE
jgi:hypothetical protein